MTKKQQWLVKGYTFISEHGMGKINIELLAARMGSSKSSFYHFYGNSEGFTTDLLNYHLQQSKELAIKIKACDKLKPDMMNVFLDNKEDILFHKQLRINRENEAYRNCFKKAYQKIEDAMLDKWIVHLELPNQLLFVKAFLNLVVENFLLRITKENFTYSWLEEYIREISYLVIQLKTVKKN